ncbi:WbqC family protein [Arenimonas sp. MALMAid1274]|uniref:WbqC family protein n=1 Tax=Arenimonas sp. MALMAid1274 TaxID=3411630 RepID=UPI003B9E729D
MKVAVMQPYFFPYIGYFQLMHAVDCFVFYDDAQYMKGGWVNRNRILLDGAPRWWTYAVAHDDYRLPIASRRYDRSPSRDRSLLDKLQTSYRHAPHYAAAMATVAGALEGDEARVSALNEQLLRRTAAGLDIGCRFVRSSEVVQDRSLSGEARVIELCRRLGATQYINAIGGRALYHQNEFALAGLELAFLQPRPLAYAQFDHAHVPFLSIVDVLMFNPPTGARAMLGAFDIVAPLQ